MSSKECPLFPPQTVACSGHGECNTTTGECECDAGWISVGDFALTIGADCDINVLAVQALWGIAIGFAFMALLAIVRYLRGQFVVWRRTHEDKSMIEFAKDSIIRSWLWFLVCYSTVIILGFLRIIYVRERYEGEDVAVTFFSVFVKGSAMCGLAGVVRGFFKFLLSSSKMMPVSVREKIRLEGEIVEKFLPFYQMASVIVCLLTFPLISHPSLLPILCGISFVGLGVLMAMIGYLACTKAILPVIQELQKHLESASGPGSVIQKDNLDQMKSLIYKLRIALLVMSQALFSLSATLILLGCWPFLLRKTSYAFPISTIAGSICALALASSLTNVKVKSSTSNEVDGGTSNATSGMKISPASP